MFASDTDWASASAQERSTALARPSSTSDASAVAARIVDDIRTRGGAAVREHAQRLDGFQGESFRIDPEAIRQARSAANSEDLDALRCAADAIRRFHVRQGYRTYEVETWPGVRTQRRVSPVDIAALYVPGGSAPLVSTLLMLAIPAQLAGVARIIIITPPQSDGSVDPGLLAAASILGLDEVYAIGGAQAIAALATGSAGLPRADKIFGPGNAYVAAAKALVSAWPAGPGIDLPAGPSEVMVLADGGANAAFVASDLLSQAEHDPMAQLVLLYPDQETLDRISVAMAEQCAGLQRRAIIEQAMANARSIRCARSDDILEVINDYAPEHLILHCNDPDQYIPGLRNVGAVFMGPWTPEALGDYAAGPNHTLPTGGAARAHSGVGVESFQKTMTLVAASPAGAAAVAPVVERLARMEGLDAHEQAMRLRRESVQGREGLPAEDPPRAAAIRRKTAETDISLSVNLDRAGPSSISTGIGYFDHMLDQIARHAGFALSIDADGDLEIDGHHTIEDVCLALGEGLRTALGDRRGMARFGFELPMDESRAGVWVDLSGRPFAQFEGQIPGESVGGFPVEMAPHAFRSLAEGLRAAVHVKVEGENAHHMIEACFKAFGRALRQAIRVEDGEIPSTKGMLA